MTSEQIAQIVNDNRRLLTQMEYLENVFIKQASCAALQGLLSNPYTSQEIAVKLNSDDPTIIYKILAGSAYEYARALWQEIIKERK